MRIVTAFQSSVSWDLMISLEKQVRAYPFKRECVKDSEEDFRAEALRQALL